MTIHGRGPALVAAVTVAVALAVGACGGDDDASDASPGGDASGAASGPLADDDGPDDGATGPDIRDGAGTGAHPCDVVDVADLETLTGVTLGAGDAMLAGDVENEVRWSATACRWEIEDQIALDLHLVRADDYDAGEVVCPELSDAVATVVDVTGLGDSAQWSYDDFGPEGELRACTATGMVTASIDVGAAGPFDETTLRSIATELVEPTLPLI